MQEVSTQSDLWYAEKLTIFYFLLPSDFQQVDVHIVCLNGALEFPLSILARGLSCTFLVPAGF